MFKRLVIFAICACLLSLNACAQELACQTDNPQLQAMPPLTVEFMRDDGTLLSVAARLAENDITRAAGFQKVCGSTVDATPIMFEFQRELLPRFHMNNVVVPLDVAFIDKAGRIESLQHMKTYDNPDKKPTYGPKRRIMAVFEAHKGFFKKHNIDLKSRVSWTRSLDHAADPVESVSPSTP